MTRRERMLAAIRRQPVDRVPYATYNMHPYTANAISEDASYGAIQERVRATAGAFIKTHSASVGPGLTRRRDDMLEVRVEGRGDARTVTTVVRTPKGDIKSIAREPENKPGMVAKPFLVTDEDIARYLSIPYEPPVYDLTETRTVYKAAGDAALVAVGFADPMYAVASLFDFEDFCIRCITDTEAVVRLIEWSYERCRANVSLLLKEMGNMDVILHTSGPEVCTPPMMPPQLFEKLVTPYLAGLISLMHDEGKLCAIHCHGHVREVFGRILDTGADVLEPIEPPDQGNITLAELMEQAGGRMGLMGHIQDQEFYAAPPGAMTRRVEEIAQVVRGKTGYIMSPTCTPFDHPCTDTYRRNYMEWLDAAERLLA